MRNSEVWWKAKEAMGCTLRYTLSDLRVHERIPELTINGIPLHPALVLECDEPDPSRAVS